MASVVAAESESPGRISQQMVEALDKHVIDASNVNDGDKKKISSNGVYILTSLDFIVPSIRRRFMREWGEWFETVNGQQYCPQSLLRKNNRTSIGTYKVKAPERIYKVGRTERMGLGRYYNHYPTVSNFPPCRNLWLFQTYVEFKTLNHNINSDLQVDIETEFLMRFGKGRNASGRKPAQRGEYALLDQEGLGGVEMVFNVPLANLEAIFHKAVMDKVEDKILNLTAKGPGSDLKGVWLDNGTLRRTRSDRDLIGKEFFLRPEVVNGVVDHNVHMKRIMIGVASCWRQGKYVEMYLWFSHIGINMYHFPDYNDRNHKAMSRYDAMLASIEQRQGEMRTIQDLRYRQKDLLEASTEAGGKALIEKDLIIENEILKTRLDALDIEKTKLEIALCDECMKMLAPPPATPKGSPVKKKQELTKEINKLRF